MHDGRWRRPACPPAPGGPVLCWCQCACRPRCQFRLKPAPSVPTPTLPVLSLHCAQVFVSGGEEGLCHSLSIASNGKARSTLLLWRGSFCTPALWSFSHRPPYPMCPSSFRSLPLILQHPSSLHPGVSYTESQELRGQP